MFHTKGRSGVQRKRITVTTNQKDNPKVYFNLTGTVVSEVNVEPRFVSFGQMQKGETGTKTVTLSIRDPQKVSIESVSVSDETFKVRLLEEEPGKKKYEVSFKADKIDRYGGKMTVKLKGAKRDRLDIPLRAEVVGDLRFTTSLYFIKRNDQFTPRELTLTSRSNKKVHVTNVVDKNGLLDFKVVTNDAPTVKIRVKVRNPEESYVRLKHGEFYVHTTDEDQPTVKVRYTISERKPRATGARPLQLNLDKAGKAKRLPASMPVPPPSAPPSTASKPAE